MKSMWMQTFAKEQEEASRKAALAQVLPLSSPTLVSLLRECPLISGHS